MTVANILQVETPITPTQPPKGRFVTNLIFNMTNFSINLLIGLWFTPYMIHHLGVAAYGLVPLALTATSYLGLFTISLNGAVGRYLTIKLEHRDYEAANKIFNTALVGIVLLVLVLLLPALWLSTHAHWFFNVPPGYDQQFSWLLLCTMGMFFLTELSCAFSVSSFSRNRFDLSNAVSILANISRVSVVVLLFTLFVPAIWHIGMGLLLAGMISIIGSIVLWRYLTPMLHIRPRMFSWQALRELTSTGGWLVVCQISTLLYLSIDLIVINKVVGVEAGGHYGAIMQWSSLLRAIAGTVAAVFSPTIIALFARGDLAGLIRYSQQSVKFLGLIISLPIGIICGLSHSLLHVWLGPGFEYLAPLLSLMTIHLCVNLGVLPLFNINIATNNIRIPGIFSCIGGLFNLGLALLFAGPFGWGMYGVAAAGAITLTAKNLLFTPLYSAYILGVKYDTFYRETLPIIGTTVGIILIGWIIERSCHLHNWLGLFAAVIIMTAIFLVSVYKLLLKKDERDIVNNMIISFIKFLPQKKCDTN